MRCRWIFFHRWEKPYRCQRDRCCRNPDWHYPAVGVKERVCAKCGQVQRKYPW